MSRAASSVRSAPTTFWRVSLPPPRRPSPESAMFKADDLAIFPVDLWIQQGVSWVALNLRPIFLAIKWPVESLLGLNDWLFHAVPFPIFVIGFFVIAWRLSTLGIAIFSAVSLIVIAMLGIWNEAMTTLSLIS